MIAQASQDAFKELLSWMTTENGQIGIFDASNVTMSRRAKLQERMNAHSERCGIAPMSLVFIESICTDESVIREQMLFKVGLGVAGCPPGGRGSRLPADRCSRPTLALPLPRPPPLPLPTPLPTPLPLTPTQVQHSPDFATMSEADALADLQLRIEHYEKIYDTVREEEGAYIKMFDLRAKARV